MEVDFKVIVSNAWKKTVVDIREGKIWWKESDIVSLFYSYLKPTIDLIPNLELYTNWAVRFKGENAKNVDLAVVKTEEIGEVDYGYPYLCFEVKYPVSLSSYREYILEDYKKLKRLCTECSEDISRENGLLINKGTKPDSGYLLVVYDEEKTDDFTLFNDIENDPHVTLLVSYLEPSSSKSSG